MTGTLVACDLDRTLIYSARMFEAHPDRTPVVAVEFRAGEAVSWVTAAAADGIARLAAAAELVPVTTRTVEQYRRVRLPGRSPRWAVAANGGVLLVDGRPDGSWAHEVAGRLAEVAALDEVRRHAERAVTSEAASHVRVAGGLFCYAAGLDTLDEDWLAAERDWAMSRGWRVSRQGSKVYWVPQPLTKSAAVAEIARRTACDRVLAAGDSLLDADLFDPALLGPSGMGFVARHGELVAGGWRAPHVRITDAAGPAAGEEIVTRLLALLARDPVRG